MLKFCRAFVCGLTVAGAMAAPTATAKGPPEMQWSVLSRFGGDADGNGRLDRPTSKTFAKLDVFPVLVRPSPALCASADSATWLVDGSEAKEVEVEAGRRCRVLIPVRGEGKHTIVARTGGRKQAAQVEIDDRLVVAIGDSVASGEGTPEGRELWLDPPCHRSAAAGFEQAARLLGQGLAQRSAAGSITFVSLACSGAEIGVGLLGPYVGVEPDDRLPPYLSQVRRLRRIAAASSRTKSERPALDAVLVSVGANDVSFSTIVKECAAPGDCRAKQEARVLAGLERLRGDYDRLGRRLDRAAPGAPVLITEYFDPTHDEGGRFCRRSVAFTSQEEARWAYEALLRPLNAEVETAAARNRWLFVDGIAADFERHGYCAGGDRWVRRLGDSAIFQRDLLGTLHPSRPGYAAIAQRVVVPLAAALGLVPPPPEPPESESSLFDDLGEASGLLTEPLFAWPWWLYRLLLLVVALIVLALALPPLRRFLRHAHPDDPSRAKPQPFPSLPHLPGSRLQQLLLLAGSAIAQLGAAVVFAGIVGGAILWLRFWSSRLPADQAVDVVAQSELIVTGTQALALFFVLSLIAVGVAWLLDGRARLARPTRRGLIALGLAEMLAAILIGEFPRDQAIQLFVGLVIAALLFHYLFDRALDRWLSPGPRAGSKSNPGWLRRSWGLIQESFRTQSGGLLRRVLSMALRAAPLVLLLGAVVLSLRADGPTRHAILLLFVLAVGLFIAPGGMARDATRKGASDDDGLQGLEVARIALASSGVLCIFILIVRDELWLAAAAAIAIVLGLSCLAVAAVSQSRFAPYCLAVLISVPLFGASTALLWGIESPEMQPVAAVLEDGKAVCGVYIGESGGKLWMGRLVLDERAHVKRPRRGNIVSFESDRIDAMTVGPLEPVARAQGRAVELREELLDERGDSGPTERSPTCAPTKPRVEVKDSWQRRLAERFQPELVIDREDGFWPVPVRTLFSMQDRRAAICRRVAPGGRGCLRLSTQGEFPWSGGDGEWLEYPAADTARDDQHDLMVDALDSGDPDATASIYFLVAGKRRGDRPITIQYWFFYPFNYQPIPGKVLEGGFHEGDFESVGVLLSGKSEQPRYLWMARHDKEGRIFPWDDDALTVVDEHPTVFVARGSHASYEHCGAQIRYVAKYGLVDDHPTCVEDRQLHLSPEATPMTDLSRVAWGCWRGLFGHKNEDRSYEQIPYLVSDAPRSPLWQQSFGEVGAEPCRGIRDPGEREGPGEEVVEGSGGVPARLRARAGRLEPLVDQCADWESPPAAGTYMVACDQGSLSAYLASGFEDPGTAGVRIDVARVGNPHVGEYALPAIRRNRDGVYLDAWRLVGANRRVVSVFASCPFNGAIIAASFPEVVVDPAQPLRLRDSGPGGRWRLTKPNGSVGATAVPFPTREQNGVLVGARPRSDQSLACGGT